MLAQTREQQPDLLPWLVGRHPRPGVYLRQVDIPGVHSKFIETNRGVLMELRVLDEQLALLPGPTQPDVTLDAGSFARLELAMRHVFVTENQVNFLAFPPVPEAVVVFGAGCGWAALARVAWLANPAIRIHCWGDIDTHGFAILDQLRRSLLMDHGTLWTQETEPARVGFAWLMAALEGLMARAPLP